MMRATVSSTDLNQHAMDLSTRPISALSPDLLAQIAKGNRPAFETLYDQSNVLLFSLAFRILGNRDEAAELLRTIYLEIWRKVARYDVGRGSPMAWLVALTRRRAIDRLRSRFVKGRGTTSSHDHTLAAPEFNQESSQPEDQAETELRTSVRQALAELPEEQRQALELAYFEGCSHAEIAERLRQPPETVKTGITVGMTRLKSALQSWAG